MSVSPADSNTATANSSFAKCGICLIEYTDTNSYSVTRCGHKFHMSCLMTHCASKTRRSKTCPLCNQEMFDNDELVATAHAPVAVPVLVAAPPMAEPAPAAPTLPVYSEETTHLMQRLMVINSRCNSVIMEARQIYKSTTREKNLELMQQVMNRLEEKIRLIREQACISREIHELIKQRPEYIAANADTNRTAAENRRLGLNPLDPNGFAWRADLYAHCYKHAEESIRSVCINPLNKRIVKKGGTAMII